MTDTPDFDKMSPEEIMKWMESLAKRQGVTEGLTTSADMDVGSVSEDDERLKGQTDYIPFGMKKEDWEKQKAKEEEQKRQRLAQQQAAPAPKPTPVPAPQPVQAPPPPPPVQAAPPPAQPAPAAAAPSDTPDFDKMSPEDIMKWMESLAKRQGVTEGLTTPADMDVGTVSEDDERLKGLGEYIPSNMKKEEWEKQKAREEEQKRQRLAQQPPAAAKPAPVQQPPAIQPPVALNDFLSGDLPGLDTDEEETVAARGTADPVDWLSSAANDPDDAFNFAVPSDDFNFDALNSSDDPLAALAQLSDNNNMDWLADLGGDSGLGALADLGAGSSDLGALDLDFGTLAPSGDAADPLDFLNSFADPSPTTPSKPTAQAAGPRPGENSLEWLESMARDQGASPEELITPASLNIARPKDIRPDGPGYTPYSFDTGDSTPDEAAVPAADLSFLEDEGSSEDWLDEVARNVSDHPKTPGRAADPAPAAKQEDVVDDVLSKLNKAENVAPEDISKMFESLFERAEQYAYRDEPAVEEPAESEEIPTEALKVEIPDWLQDQMIMSSPTEATPGSDAAKMDSLMKMFDEEPAPESFTAQAAPASSMPDWLRETPDGDVPAVGVDLSGSSADSDLPDWLQAGEDEGSDENIFAEQNTGMPWDQDAEALFATDAANELGALMEDEDEEPAFELDTSDRWVEALTLEEEAEDQLAQWYAEKTGAFSEDDLQAMIAEAAPTPTPATATAQASSGALMAAQLPVEAVLILGDAEPAPSWLTGIAAPPAATIPAPVQAQPAVITGGSTDDDVPDWLREQAAPITDDSDLDDIPDWLREQVDDSVAEAASDLPPWLTGDDGAVSPDSEDLPDWLRDTLTEETASATSAVAEPEPLPPTVVMPKPNIVTPPPTPTQVPAAAIQPVKSSPAPMIPVNIDVASTLQAARGKVSSGDINGSLADYELIVRANTALDDVVKDLSKLVDHKDHKKNPALYRVLGDTLMRRGDLKSALETYRKALNML